MKHEGIGGVTRFVIMNNIFDSQCEMSMKFDLKGSTLGRFVPLKERKPGVLLKDQDIKDIGKKLYFPPKIREEFMKMIKKDSDFLASHKVMDYSLLLGIYTEEPNETLLAKPHPIRLRSISAPNQPMFGSGGICAVRPDGVHERYFIGIIDILIQYGSRKRAESLLKSVVYSEEASVVPPDRYAERFQEFIFGLLPEQIDDEPDSESSTEATHTPRDSLVIGTPPKEHVLRDSTATKRKS